QATRTDPPHSELSDRQLEVLKLLATGLSIRNVAETLQLARKTIEHHKRRLMSRIGAENQVEVCRYAIRHGLIEP
ncbi:MAG: LuxR C-terminal-related transcriptional regulator, partial [Planctomycetota bacterium]|nr:LuxR C-terminal-related transcriptional regulator [Planctomycetota bacterium]